MKKYIWLISIFFLIFLSADDGGYKNVAPNSDDFGKYSFTPAQGANLCKNPIIGNLGCCDGTYVLRDGRTITNGFEWRLGVNAMRCQEEMCRLANGGNDAPCRKKSCERHRGVGKCELPSSYDECTAFRRDCH